MALNWLKSALALMLAIACGPFANASDRASFERASVGAMPLIARLPENHAGEPRPHASFPRIVSLAPSNTELLFSLEAGESLVGVSMYCDYPPEAKKRAKVGTFTAVNLERLARLKPDAVLLVNGQEALATTMRRRHFNVVVLHNDSLSQISTNLRTLGALTGNASTADRTADSLSQCLKKLAAITESASRTPTVFYCVWPQPLLTAGGKSFLNEVITASGGTNIARHLQTAYPHFSLERLVIANPEVIVLPFQARGQKFLTRAPWSSLSAIKNGRVFFLPEQDLDNLSRPTLRILNGLYWLSIRLHPELSRSLDTWYAETRASFTHR